MDTHVLVVGTSRENQVVIQAALPSYELSFAQDGKQALECIARLSDLVLILIDATGDILDALMLLHAMEQDPRCAVMLIAHGGDGNSILHPPLTAAGVSKQVAQVLQKKGSKLLNEQAFLFNAIFWQAPMGITMRELLDLAGGMRHPERPIKFWTPGGSSTPLFTADERKAMRQRHTQPVLDALHQWMTLQRHKLPDSSATAKTLDYSLRRLVALARFADDGQLPVDNNWIENQIRPIAIGRNNWLFAGSLRAGQRAAAVAARLSPKVVRKTLRR